MDMTRARGQTANPQPRVKRNPLDAGNRINWPTGRSMRIRINDFQTRDELACFRDGQELEASHHAVRAELAVRVPMNGMRFDSAMLL
jgi:hypothetical protein